MENLTNVKNDLRGRVADGEVGRVLKILTEIYPNDKDIISMSNRYNRYLRERTLVLGSSDDLEVKVNSIVYALLSFIDKIPEKEKVGIIDVEEKEEIVKDVSFWNWLFSETKKINLYLIFPVTVFSFAISLFSLITALSGGKPFDSFFTDLTFYGYVTHVLIAVIAIFVIPKVDLQDKALLQSLEKDSDDFPALKEYIERSNEVVKEFRRFWWITWIGWCLLYLLLIFKGDKVYTLLPIQKLILSDYILNTFLNIFRGISIMGIIACFSILYFKNKGSKTKHYINPATFIIALFLIFMFLYEMFVCSNSTSVQTEMYFQMIALLTTGVSISLLTSRLEGRLINTPIWFSIAFYFYAGTQIANAFLDYLVKDPQIGANFADSIRAFILNYSLFAKCLLFLFVIWLLEKGKLLIYSIRINSIMDSISNQK